MMGTVYQAPDQQPLPRIVPSQDADSPLPLIRLLAQIAARQSAQGTATPTTGGTQC